MSPKDTCGDGQPDGRDLVKAAGGQTQSQTGSACQPPLRGLTAQGPGATILQLYPAVCTAIAPVRNLQDSATRLQSQSCRVCEEGQHCA